MGQSIEAVLSSGIACTFEDVRLRFDRATPHEEVFVTFSFSPLFGEAGRVDGVFVVCREMPEERLDAQRLESLSQRYAAEYRRARALNETHRMRTDYCKQLSRNFQAPLSIVRDSLETALQLVPAADSDVLQPPLRSARRAAQRVQQLAADLDHFARVEALRSDACFTPTDLAALTSELSAVFRAAVRHAGIEVVVDCEPLLEQVMVDREMWERVVLNLLWSSFKSTPERRVELTLRGTSGRVELGVCDARADFDSAERGVPFEFARPVGPSGRAEAEARSELTLVRDMVLAHGGEMRVARLGNASKFTVTLGQEARTELAAPALDSTPPRLQVDAARRISGAGAAPSRDVAGARILIVDSNPDSCDALIQLLTPRFSVECIADMPSALATAQRDHFDLIVGDMMSPRFNGIELLRALRGAPTLAQTPVIVLSDPLGPERRREILESGADDCVVKPFAGHELLARVEARLTLAARRSFSTGHAALQRFHEASTRLHGGEPLPEIIEAVLDAALALADAPMGCLQLLDPADGAALVAQAGLHADLSAQLLRASGECESTQQPARRIERKILSDVELSAALAPGLGAQLSRDGVRAFLSTPVVTRSQKHVGTLVTAWPAPHRPARGNLQWLDLLASHTADLINYRQREQALASARDSALQANESKSRFLAAVSHELRQPLQAILLVQSIFARALQAGELLTYVELLGESARNMDELLGTLLDIHRLETGAIQPQQRPFILDEVLERVRNELGHVAARKGLSFSVESCAERVESDPSLLLVILRNLIGNAIKYTDRGRIEVRVRCEESELFIEVSDSGIGIPHEQLELIFEAFYQIDNPNRDDNRGIGLGLAIVHQIASLLGLRIHVESLEANGSTFLVALPRLPAAPSVAEACEAPNAGALTLLHIEDDPAIARLMSQILSGAGYNVVSAGSIAEALDRVVVQHVLPDLILTDYQLAGGATGEAAVREISKRLGVRPPTLLLTGDIAVERRLRDASVVDRVLAKPIEVEVLVNELAELSRLARPMTVL